MNIVNKPAPPPRSRPSPAQPALPDGYSLPSSGVKGTGQYPAKAQGGLAPGAIVLVDGLVNAQHLNGLEAVLSHFDSEKGRWYVNLQGGETKAMKPENLIIPNQKSGSRPPPGKPAQARMGASADMRSQGHVPQKAPRPPQGPASPHYGNVSFSSSAPGAPSVGDTVRIQGLVNAAHLNRSVAVVEGFDQDSQRWRVQLQNGESKAVRLENLEILGPARRAPSPAGNRPPSAGSASPMNRDRSSGRIRRPSVDRATERNMYR